MPTPPRIGTNLYVKSIMTTEDVHVALQSSTGFARLAIQFSGTSPDETNFVYANGCQLTLAINGQVYVNTAADGVVPTWVTSSAGGLNPTNGQYKTFLTVGTANADFVTDGVADDVQINAAIAAVEGVGGGIIFIKSGQYNIQSSIAITSSNICLYGSGASTHIFVTNGNPCNIVSISGTGVAKVQVKNMWLDGNKANNSFGDGIILNTPWQNTDPHHVFEDLLITDCKNNGVEVVHSSDTRITYWNRVHVRNADGNGFYLPWPSHTDSFFTDCVAELCLLNGWYIGCESCWFTNCNSFFNGGRTVGVSGGNNHGWYFSSYNNWLTGCQAQDNWQSGFYSQNDGDATYGCQCNTLVNCQADSNGQGGNASYGCGIQLINTFGWEIIGGAYFTRPYPFTYQRIGISLQGSTNGTLVSDATITNNITNYSDTSTGDNYYKPGATGQMWEDNGFLSVRAFGAKGDGKRLFGAVASSSSTTVTCASASFSSADVGKSVMVFSEGNPGTITTIASVTNSTTIVLAANSGVTTTNLTGYVIYGTDDSAIIQKVLNLAAFFVQSGNNGDFNEPLGSGNITVTMPGDSVECLYITTAQLTIPYGVFFDADGHLANMLPSRNTPVLIIQSYGGIKHLEIENLYGTGILAGGVGAQGNIKLWDVSIWHGLGSSTAPVGLAGTPSGAGGALAAGTYYWVITAIDSTGGETKVSNEVTATTTGSTSSVALSWTAFSGAVSYRIYRGTGAGLENLYYTSSTNSFTDIGATGTFDYPIPPGYGFRLNGSHYEVNYLYAKECTTGIYHHSGDDTAVNKVFLVGCVTPIRMRKSNQVHYTHVFLDTCGGTGSLGGVLMDDGCTNINFENIQVFENIAVTRTLTPIVGIGTLNGTQNIDIKLRIQASNTGGVGLSIQNATDVVGDLTLSNTVIASGNTNPIVTAVSYGTGLSGFININANLSAGIVPNTGTAYSGYSYIQGGVQFQNTSFPAQSRRDAWVFPDNTINAAVDIQATRFYAIKALWYEINSSGVLVLRNNSSYGSNFYYTTANAALMNANATETYVTLTTAAITNIGTMTISPTLRANATAALVSFCQTNQFTGVELDCEVFSISQGATVAQYTNFKTWISELGTALHVAGFKLIMDLPPIWDNGTSATPPEWNGRNSSAYYTLNYADLNNLPIDYLCPLAFDYQDDLGGGYPNQPIAWMQAVATWIKSQVSDVNRIVMGLPSAGYAGPTNGFQNVGHNYTYFTAQANFSSAVRDATYGSGELNFKNTFMTLTLSAAPASGATSASLSTGFTGTTDTYEMVFSTGDIRSVSLTNGSTAVSWTPGLTGAATTTVTLDESLWFMDDISMLQKIQGAEQFGITRVSLWYAGGNKYSNQRTQTITPVERNAVIPYTPSIRFATDYPASTRFSSAATNGTATYTAEGLTLTTSATTTSYIRNLYVYSPDTTNNQIFNGNPRFTVNVTLVTAGTITGQWYGGLNNIPVSGTGHTFTSAHVGFKMTTSGGVTTLYATQADNTTENAVALTTVVQNDTLLLCVQIISGQQAIYWWQKNYNGWNGGTVLTANLPTNSIANTLTTYIQQSVSNVSTANAFTIASTGTSVTY